MFVYIHIISFVAETSFEHNTKIRQKNNASFAYGLNMLEYSNSIRSIHAKDNPIASGRVPLASL